MRVRLPVDMKYDRIAALLTLVNFFVLQWFTLRLFVVVEGEDEVTSVGLFANAVPLTGWDFLWKKQQYVMGDKSMLLWAHLL